MRRGPVATIVTATLTVAVGIAQTLAPVTGVLQRDAARVLGGEWWRLATTMFVHGGVGHLLFNLAGILLVGMALEHRVGAWRWVVVYVVSGMGAGLAEVLIDPVGVDTGASGGVAGLIGALLVVSARRREPQWWPGWVLLRVLLALVAFGALALVVRLDVHGFGLVIGAALGFAPGFTRAPRARAPASPRRRGPSGRDGRQASPSAPGRGR